MSLLTVTEQRQVETQIDSLRARLEALRQASMALNGRSAQARQKPTRHRKAWSAAARKAQSQKLKAIWAKKRKGQI